jgi:SOS-response transcriptional repressor LexA
MSHPPSKPSYTVEELLKRIEQRREELGLTERAAAVLAGLSPSQIRTMRRQYVEGKQRAASLRTIDKLAGALRTTPEWLTTGVGQESVRPAERVPAPQTDSDLRLMGAVAAGVWLENSIEAGQSQHVSVPPDPRYPFYHQFAYEVRGSSTDRFARPGDFLIVVDRQAANLALRPGDIVIATVKKGRLHEVTARRYTLGPYGHELHYEASEPPYQTGIFFSDTEGSEGVTIGGIVVAVYRKLT